MSDIKFRIAAKTDVGCVRTNNEDNFQAAADLTQQSMTWVNNQTYDLGANGALMVVADGMGGMNAGEVASAIAIDTVREFFTPENLTPEVLKNRFTIEKFMKDVAVEGDRRIKRKSTSETHGMGTTIVMAWLLDGFCYICWCGDSRAYIYNKTTGLFQVTKDHSYVQTLVDAGEISEEDAFDYPNSNVITRCLCDAKQKAEPDCLLVPQPLCDGDIILLCSDGLSGLLRDYAIQKIVESSTDNVNVMTDNLIDAALAAGGNDNVTVAVAAIDSGGAVSTADRVPNKVLPKPHSEPAIATNASPLKTIPPAQAPATPPVATPAAAPVAPETPAAPDTSSADNQGAPQPVDAKKKKSHLGLWIAIVVALLLVGGGIAYFMYSQNETTDKVVVDDDEDDLDDEDDSGDVPGDETSADEVENAEPEATSEVADVAEKPATTPTTPTTVAPAKPKSNSAGKEVKKSVEKAKPEENATSDSETVVSLSEDPDFEPVEPQNKPESKE